MHDQGIRWNCNEVTEVGLEIVSDFTTGPEEALMQLTLVLD